MTEDAKLEGWANIIEAVKTPLGFFTLLALIISAILTSASVLTERVSIIYPLTLLGIIAVLVFLIAWNKPHAFYPPKYWPKPEARTILVKLKFPPLHAREVDLDIPNCELEVRNKKGRHKFTMHPNFKQGDESWNFEAPETVEPSDSMRLVLAEHNERKWKVQPFDLYETVKEAQRI